MCSKTCKTSPRSRTHVSASRTSSHSRIDVFSSFYYRCQIKSDTYVYYRDPVQNHARAMLNRPQWNMVSWFRTDATNSNSECNFGHYLSSNPLVPSCHSERSGSTGASPSSHVERSGDTRAGPSASISSAPAAPGQARAAIWSALVALGQAWAALGL